MLIGLYIFVDEEFSDPLYADPDPEDLEEDYWSAVCEAVVEALEGDREAVGVVQRGEAWLGWRTMPRSGLSFVAVVTDDVKPASVAGYLQHLARTYMDEVDDPLNPERDGVEDVVVEVIPPWEDEDE
jgi:hypothetical protein